MAPVKYGLSATAKRQAQQYKPKVSAKSQGGLTVLTVEEKEPNPNGRGTEKQVYKRFFDEIGNPPESYILRSFNRLNDEFSLFSGWAMDEDDFYDALLRLGYFPSQKK